MLERIKRFFERKHAEARFHPVRVRCARCVEVLETRVDLHNDLSVRFDPRGRVQGYYVRKVLHGSGRNLCFAAVEVELFFDAQRRLVDRRIQGGTFLDDAPSIPST